MTHEVASAEQLVALLRGELSRDEARRVVQHLRQCDSCRTELVDVASVHGSLTAAGRLLRDDVPTSEEPAALPALTRLEVRSPRRRLPMLLAACAATVVVLAGALAGINHWRGDGGSAPSSRSVALQPVTGDATGSVSMAARDAGADLTRMRITTSGLSPAGEGRFYYAWLLDPATQKMLPLGVVSPDGATRFDVADDLISRYHAVDISLQDDDGNPEHSATSVLRAQY